MNKRKLEKKLKIKKYPKFGSNKGITLLALIITIIITIILAVISLDMFEVMLDDLINKVNTYKISQENEEKILTNLSANIEKISEKATTLGIGGYGGLMFPKISPNNPNTMMAICDMGGVYVSHNKGETWSRKSLNGNCYTIEFDPNNENVVYVGGSGLHKSTDNGKTFELIFPKEENITKTIYKLETRLSYMYNTEGYPTSRVVKDILVDPNDSKHIYALLYTAYTPVEIEIYESKDGGNTFLPLEIDHKKEIVLSNQLMDYNEMFMHQGNLRYSIQEGIFEYNEGTGTITAIYKTSTEIVDVAQVIENNEIYYILLEKTSEQAGVTKTTVRYTKDFITYTDITEKIIDSLDESGTVYTDFEWEFTFVEATSLSNIYLVQGDYFSSQNYPHGIIKYNREKAVCIYGTILKNKVTLENPGWADDSLRIWGLAIDTKKENNAILFTTIIGVYYSPDSTKVYQRYCNAYEDGTYSTNGIDVQVAYGIRHDPFDENHIMLLYTDLGLASSNNNGETWKREKNKFPANWTNTCYDLQFDQEKEGVAYSLWSNKSNVLNLSIRGDETTNRYGGFAISYDSGETWNSTYSTGIPEHATPVKMSIKYNENNDERTIYVATCNAGFFVSYNSGKTFEPINNGIEKIAYNGYEYIFGADIEVTEGRIFALTRITYYNNATQAGKVYELIDGTWQQIELPEGTIYPKDIYYKNGVLYISAISNFKADNTKEGMSNYGGGIYTYTNGKITQIFDETISAAGVQIDSKGNLYISDMFGNIYIKNQSQNFEKIYSNFHWVSGGIQLKDDYTLYLTSFGGGLLKIKISS